MGALRPVGAPVEPSMAAPLEPEPEPEPELTKSELKQRARLAKAEAKAEARAKKERDVLQKQFEKKQRAAAAEAKKKRREDPAFAAAVDREQAEDDWQTFSSQPGLALRVEEARDIGGKGKDKGKGADPYVVLRFSGETFRTEAVKNNSDNPVWRDFFVFPDCPHNGRVDLEIWNKNFLGRDDPLGMVGLKAHQVLDLQGEGAEGNFDTWLYLQPLGSCASPTGALRLIATMGDRKTKRKLKHTARTLDFKQDARDEAEDEEKQEQEEDARDGDEEPEVGQQFRSRKELMEATAAAREAKVKAKATEDMEAYLVEVERERVVAEAAAREAETERQRVEALAAKEELEKQEAADKLAAEQKELEAAAQLADQEEADLMLAQERAAKEKAELDAAHVRVTNLEDSLAAAREDDDLETQQRLLRELEEAQQVEAAERADYEAAEKQRRAEKMEADDARAALAKEQADAAAAQEAFEQQAAEAANAAEDLEAATAVVEEAKEIASNIIAIGGDPDEVAQRQRRAEENEAKEQAQAEAEAAEQAAATATNEEKMKMDDRLRQAAARPKTGGSNETFYSVAARRNEEEAAHGTDWERTRTAEGQREWKDKRALLAGTWSGKPGSRLTSGLYSANRLDPRRATAGSVRSQEKRMPGRGARSREYLRCRRLISAAYPTLAEPLEPDMAAWGVRAPPPFHPPPDKPRIAGKLQKWRPAVLEDTGVADDAWRTRWVELRMDTAARPVFDTVAEEQACITAEIAEDLASSSVGKSKDEIKTIMRSINLQERSAGDDEETTALVFSNDAEDRRKRRRLRPVLCYCHKKGGRELGRLDLRGATLIRSYRPPQKKKPNQAPVEPQAFRPLMPGDLDAALGSGPSADESMNKTAVQAKYRLQLLVGEGPRAAALRDAVLECVESWGEDPDVASPSTHDTSTASATATATATAAALQVAPISGRACYLTVTVKDPHGGRPQVVSPDPTWENGKIKRLRSEVGGSSRLDAILALIETRGNLKRAKARLGSTSETSQSHSAPEDVARLLRSAVLTTTVSATFGSGGSEGGGDAEEYLQSWFEQLRYACWETDLSADRHPWEDDGPPVEERPPPKQEGPRSFDPPGGPQDGPVYKTKGHPAFYQPPPASLYGVRGKLRYELEMTGQRYVPFQSGLYRRQTDVMEVAAATRAAMSWRAGGKATNGGERWAPKLDDRKAVVMKAFTFRTEDNGGGKSVGEVAAEGA